MFLLLKPSTIAKEEEEVVIARLSCKRRMLISVNTIQPDTLFKTFFNRKKGGAVLPNTVFRRVGNLEQHSQ